MRKLFFLMVWVPGVVWGAGPILVDSDGDGSPVVWENHVVRYNPESEGGLGRLTNTEALQMVRDLFEEWRTITINGVATVDLTIEEGSGLGNVDGNNVDQFFSYCPAGEVCPSEGPPFVLGGANSGQSPILFDDDGEITDLIQGEGAKRSILGFAGPRVIDVANGDMVIKEGQAVLNGYFIDCPEGADPNHSCQSAEVSLPDFEGVIFHELGHLIGLDHSQVNLSSAAKALRGDDSESDAIPTMFPIFVDGVAQGTPHYDDKVAISFLYPSSAYTSGFCTLAGKVYESNGTTEMQGVNVVVTRVDNPLVESTSFVSGSYYTGTPGTCDNAVGDFTLTGLVPGVAYQLSIEKISQAFTGGSSIEPCDPPATGFNADTLEGTFSCGSGGEVITTGTVATTAVITTKESTTTGTAGGGESGSSAGGCSLVP